MTNKSIVIVGTGFTGAYIGRELAERGWNVHILERRPQIGGQMYDKVNEMEFATLTEAAVFLSGNNNSDETFFIG